MHTDLDDLYEVNMLSLTWTQVQTSGSLSPMKRHSHSFTAISDEQILLYGESNDNTSWILDLPSLSWREHHVPTHFDVKATEIDGR